MAETTAETSQKDPRKFPFPPAIPVAALLLAWLMEVVWPLGIHFPAWLRWVGAFLMAAPFLLAIWAARTFRRHGTVVNPLGESTRIVTAGPFQFTRNPMYLSLMILYLGGTLAFHLPWGLVLLVPVFLALHFGVILHEERYLAAKFGPDYAAYRQRVRRWV
ncbi:MAG TPA: isoprenylcysteine carboxylmethyltransferase family protein [Tepidisphaeraceae bacterium]|nr:isoprenylcysteine carboxylmethyltransferase family protein [Tepidisphaeraceae bacterium]